MTVYEGDGVALDLYQRGPGTRQHVDLRSTDRAAHMAVSGQRVSVGAPHSLPRPPRVGGAALCIIDSGISTRCNRTTPPF